MNIELSAEDRTDLVAATSAVQRVRQWRRYQALLLLAEGQTPQAVAQALGASRSGVYNGAAQWRGEGLSGLDEGPHVGVARRFAAAGEHWLDALLASDPQSHGYQTPGWTVPLLQHAAVHAGYVVSRATLRRTIRRVGWRWKRPKYVLGRPDPQYAEKKSR